MAIRKRLISLMDNTRVVLIKIKASVIEPLRDAVAGAQGVCRSGVRPTIEASIRRGIEVATMELERDYNEGAKFPRRTCDPRRGSPYPERGGRAQRRGSGG